MFISLALDVVLASVLRLVVTDSCSSMPSPSFPFLLLPPPPHRRLIPVSCRTYLLNRKKRGRRLKAGEDLQILSLCEHRQISGKTGRFPSYDLITTTTVYLASAHSSWSDFPLKRAPTENFQSENSLSET